MSNLRIDAIMKKSERPSFRPVIGLRSFHSAIPLARKSCVSIAGFGAPNRNPRSVALSRMFCVADESIA